MPSVVSHGIAAMAIGKALHPSAVPGRLRIAGVACSVIPDLDVIGFRFDIPYHHFLGHRGVSHSLMFAAALGALGTGVVRLRGASRVSCWRVWLYLFLATASHGLLDALTNGGRGVALLAPFDNTRYFFPVRPILVAPLGLTRFMSSRGVAVLASEACWVWLPSALLALAGHAWWRHRTMSNVTRYE